MQGGPTDNIAEEKYDVFLCYDTVSDKDKRLVKEFGNRLKARGIEPWLDDWAVRPGTPWIPQVEKQIKYIEAAAVFVGQKGVGPWQQQIIGALLTEFVERGCPVIPVLLQNASGKPKLPIFLNGMRWVDLADTDSDEDPLETLIWGITGKHGEINKRISHILVTVLGESPVTVSAMYDLLTKKEGLTIDKVIVLYSQGEDTKYQLVREALGGVCELQNEILPVEDDNSQMNAYIFCKHLYALLNTCQIQGDTVYLSLSAGSEGIEAIVASAASFFPCIRNLYYIIDPYEKYILPFDNLKHLPTVNAQMAMHPNYKQLTLMNIPFQPVQQLNNQIISHLLTTIENELTRMQAKGVQSSDVQIKSILIVPLTRFSMVATQLYALLTHQERRNIRAVIMLYPAQSTEITSRVQYIRQAMREEANISCVFVTIQGLEEIASTEASQSYQAVLERVIDQAHEMYPDCIIDLALSENLESVIAMTIFAAQKKHLIHIYHRLVIDKELAERIDRQTTIEALINLSAEENNESGDSNKPEDRLFLRAYEEEDVYKKLQVIKLPVFFP